MKLDWGHGIAIALGSFMIFILALLFSAGDTGSLVTENYYEKELTFQNEIDALRSAKALPAEEQPEVIMQANGINFDFPDSIDASQFKGEVYLLRNEDDTKDVRMPIKLQSRNQFLVPSVKLQDGVYELNLSWKINDKEYLIKKSIRWISQ